MTQVYSHGPLGTIAHEPMLGQAVVVTKGSATAKPAPADAYLAFQKALSRGVASYGTYTCNGATAVVTSDVNILPTSIVLISLNTFATLSSPQYLSAISSGASFSTKGTATDVSTYNYAIINLA